MSECRTLQTNRELNCVATHLHNATYLPLRYPRTSSRSAVQHIVQRARSRWRLLSSKETGIASPDRAKMHDLASRARAPWGPVRARPDCFPIRGQKSKLATSDGLGTFFSLLLLRTVAS